jgi:hypothetical protein
VGHLYALLGHCRVFATVTGHCRRIKMKPILKGDNARIRYAVCRVENRAAQAGAVRT